MTDFLIRHFIANYQDTENTKVRTAYSLLGSIVGICCNLLLFAAKLLIGLFANSISIMADGFNNLSDAASSIIGFVGMKIAGKPADESHPFGHGRVEYISAFIVACIVIQVGFSLLKGSVQKIMAPDELVFGYLSVAILVMSVLMKAWMSVFNRSVGTRIHSQVLIATSADSLGDVLATSATIVSMLAYEFFGLNIDGVVGLVVSILILIGGVNIAKDTLAPLIGQAIDPEAYREISKFVESYEGIVNSHDLIVHNYGPSHSMASIHAEVPNDVDIEVSHEIIDRIERDALQQLGLFLVIHMDPVEMKDEAIVGMRAMAEEIVIGIEPRLKLHDFRVVEGQERTNLIFDVAVPAEYTKDMQEGLRKDIEKEVRQRDSRYHCVMTIEHGFEAER